MSKAHQLWRELSAQASGRFSWRPSWGTVVSYLVIGLVSLYYVDLALASAIPGWARPLIVVLFLGGLVVLVGRIVATRWGR